MTEIDFKLIEKEEIVNLHFPKEDVLKKSDEIKERNRSIERAISLGNLEHTKVKIYFSDEQGKKKVHTTIWAVTDTAIVLKQNTILPINRIHKLEI
jgi:outer membrane protease